MFLSINILFLLVGILIIWGVISFMVIVDLRNQINKLQILLAKKFELGPNERITPVNFRIKGVEICKDDSWEPVESVWLLQYSNIKKD